MKKVIELLQRALARLETGPGGIFYTAGRAPEESGGVEVQVKSIRQGLLFEDPATGKETWT